MAHLDSSSSTGSIYSTDSLPEIRVSISDDSLSDDIFSPGSESGSQPVFGYRKHTSSSASQETRLPEIKEVQEELKPLHSRSVSSPELRMNTEAEATALSDSFHRPMKKKGTPTHTRFSRSPTRQKGIRIGHYSREHSPCNPIDTDSLGKIQQSDRQLFHEHMAKGLEHLDSKLVKVGDYKPEDRQQVFEQLKKPEITDMEVGISDCKVLLRAWRNVRRDIKVFLKKCSCVQLTPEIREQVTKYLKTYGKYSTATLKKGKLLKLYKDTLDEGATPFHTVRQGLIKTAAKRAISTVDELRGKYIRQSTSLNESIEHFEMEQLGGEALLDSFASLNEIMVLLGMNESTEEIRTPATDSLFSLRTSIFRWASNIHNYRCKIRASDSDMDL